MTACAEVYGGDFSVGNDLNGVLPIEAFSDPVKQQKYVHMYFAKNVGLGRALRDRIRVDSAASVYSVGAGPCLDLFGWFWDAGPSAGPVHAVDVMSWSDIRSLDEWERLKDVTVPTLEYEDHSIVPGPTNVPQASGQKGLRRYPSSAIPDGSTVLFPWTLNHVLGALDSTSEAGSRALGRWLEEVRRRRVRIVVAR